MSAQKVGERITGGCYTAGDDLLVCTPSTHLVADDKLVSYLFFPMIYFVSASKISFDSCRIYIATDSYPDIYYRISQHYLHKKMYFLGPSYYYT